MSEIAAQNEGCGADRHSALERFEKIRHDSEALAANLAPEDQSIQSMPDVSPTKWHLGAHHLVFRDVPAGPSRCRLSGVRPGIRLFVQLLLRGGRAASSAPRARAAVAPDRRHRRRLSRPRRPRDEPADRARREARLEPDVASRRARAASRAAASGADPDGHQARFFPQSLCCRPIRRRSCSCSIRSSRSIGSSSPAACGKSAIPVRHSPSTTRPRATRYGWSHSARQRGRQPAANISALSRTAGIRGPNSGCRTAGRRFASRVGRRPSTGGMKTASGRCSRCQGGAGSIRPSRFAMSASMRPTPSPNGPASGCRPKPNGRSRPRMCRFPAISPIAVISTLAPAGLYRRPTARHGRGRCSATFGSGRRAPTPLIRASAPRGGCHRRIQREIHVQSDGPAGRRGGYPGGASAGHLSQFFPPSARWAFAGLRLAEDI